MYYKGGWGRAESYTRIEYQKNKSILQKNEMKQFYKKKKISIAGICAYVSFTKSMHSFQHMPQCLQYRNEE